MKNCSIRYIEIVLYCLLITGSWLKPTQSSNLSPATFSNTLYYIFNESNTAQTSWHKEFYEHFTSLQTASNITTPCSALTLKKKGVPTQYLDYMATLYTELSQNTFISIFFPPTSNNLSKAIATLNEYGQVVYTKKIKLNQKGFCNLLKLIYEVHHCNGWREDMNGIYARYKNLLRLDHHEVSVVLWECSSLQRAIESKRKIRSIYDNHDNTVCHYTDKHHETIYVSQSLFNENTVNFFNTKLNQNYKNLNKYLHQLQSTIKKHPELKDSYCIDTGGVLAAHGLRDCGDIDLILDTSINNKFTNIGLNNATRINYGFNIEELIYNPNNFFYYKRLKFLSLKKVR
ncbi:MAG: hypothetical protein WD512_19860, partial [Candidatus Paceibacterota bacterium]